MRDKLYLSYITVMVKYLFRMSYVHFIPPCWESQLCSTIFNLYSVDNATTYPRLCIFCRKHQDLLHEGIIRLQAGPCRFRISESLALKICLRML